tara:strand:- start:2907 stop:3494 length:588 start_codon:yes stop_codon:yes gene_type:complete
MAEYKNITKTMQTDDSDSIPPGAQAIIIGTKKGKVNLYGPEDYIVKETLSELSLHGYSSPFGIGPGVNNRAEELINSLGFSFVENEELSPGLSNLKEFTLVGSTNVDETIQNSKIIDPDIAKLTPVKKEATEKFKSETDSFYDLDNEREESIKKVEAFNDSKKKKRAPTIAKQLAKKTRISKNKMLAFRKRRFAR